MGELLRRRWWIFALRGVLSIILGVLAIVWPAITVVILTILIGAYLIVDGLVAIYHGAIRHHEPRWVLVFQGVLSVILGVLIAVWPGTGVLALVIMLGIWSLAVGAAHLVSAFQLRGRMPTLWLGVSGGLSVVFGLLLILLPLAGAFALALLIGAYAVLLGILQLLLGLRLRRFDADTPPPGRHRSANPGEDEEEEN